jgi:hypothetical protein
MVPEGARMSKRVSTLVGARPGCALLVQEDVIGETQAVTARNSFAR